MCGISGIIDLKDRTEKSWRVDRVGKMNAKLKHRGPDDQKQLDFDQCSLAVSRLAIIDLETGNQPIFNEDGTICVFFNGEIYNHPELREDLQAKGHQFKTQTDTEVLVHLYEEMGTNLCNELRGMFAFIIYDQKEQRFFMGRDPWGEKPFYYHMSDGVFSFSSEINSLLQNERIPRKVDPQSVQYFLRSGFIPEPETLLQKVYSLQAGHQMVLNANGLTTEKFFEVDYTPNRDLKSLQDCVDYIRPILQNSIQSTMRSDVPVGAFLSGGIDSSTVVVNMQKFSDNPIDTCTVKFQDELYDESPVARAVAEKAGTNHHEITVPNKGFTQELFWTILDHTGQPFPDTSAIPTYYVSKEIKKHVSVALSGDGGDEMFAGYKIFQWYQKIQNIKRVPKPIRQVGHAFYSTLGMIPGFNDSSKIRQITKGLRFSMYKSKEIPNIIQELMSKDDVSKLFKPGLLHDFEKYHAFWDEAQHFSTLRQIMYHRLRYNLPLGMSVKVDRMSMAHSLEVRSPYFDPDIFRATASLPDEFMIANGFGKQVTRTMSQDDLPPESFSHPKTGFALPLHKYQNEEYKELAEILFTKNNPMSELIDLKTLQGIKELGLGAKKDTAQLSVYRAGQRLWALMALFGWAERYQVEA